MDEVKIPVEEMDEIVELANALLDKFSELRVPPSAEDVKKEIYLQIEGVNFALLVWNVGLLLSGAIEVPED